MLDKKTFIQGMSMLNVAFPKHELNHQQTELYYSRLCNYEDNEFKYAINSLIDTNEFMPTIATIKKQIDALAITDEEQARDFESKLFSVDTDTLAKHFERTGDDIAVEVIKNNYKTLRECNLNEVHTIKAQMREQYKNKQMQRKKYGIAKENNIPLSTLLGNAKKRVELNSPGGLLK